MIRFRKEKGEITIETTIVLTIIMMIIGLMIYVTLYVRDVATINAYSYSAMVQLGSDEEYGKTALGKITNAPLFVIKPKVSISDGFNECEATINYHSLTSMGWLRGIIPLPSDSYSVAAVKRISYEKMCLYKSVKDGLKK